MSRAFVKEGDGAEAEPLAELQVSPHRNLVTAAGLAQIQAHVERLRADLTGARAAEDRSAILRIQRDLRYWSERQRTAEPVPAPAPGGPVRFGSSVILESADGSQNTYRIVGEDEADPAQGRISYVSPLATRLIGGRVDDEVELPDGVGVIVEIR